MNTKDLMSPLSNEQLSSFKDDCEIIRTLSQESIASTSISLIENMRSQQEFIEKLQNTPITIAISNWLSNLREGTRKNYAYYIGDMIRRKIIPEFEDNGEPFTIGHFRHIPHEMVI